MRFLVDFHTKIQLHLIRKCTNCYTSKFWKTLSQIGGFFNKYFQVVIETCEFLKADLNLVFLSRTTYTSHWVPQIFCFFFLVVYISGKFTEATSKIYLWLFVQPVFLSILPHTSTMYTGRRIIFFSFVRVSFIQYLTFFLPHNLGFSCTRNSLS